MRAYGMGGKEFHGSRGRCVLPVGLRDSDQPSLMGGSAGNLGFITRGKSLLESWVQLFVP